MKHKRQRHDIEGVVVNQEFLGRTTDILETFCPRRKVDHFLGYISSSDVVGDLSQCSARLPRATSNVDSVFKPITGSESDDLLDDKRMEIGTTFGVSLR